MPVLHRPTLFCDSDNSDSIMIVIVMIIIIIMILIIEPWVKEVKLSTFTLALIMIGLNTYFLFSSQ